MLPYSVSEVLAEEGRRWLLEAASQAREAEPQVDVSRVLERTDPATVLIAESETAQLLVLGSRGLGGFTGLLVGAVYMAYTLFEYGFVSTPHALALALVALGQIVFGMNSLMEHLWDARDHQQQRQHMKVSR